jgi:PhzF family phenazine biosynthesis protein
MATMAPSRTITVEIVGGFVTSEGGGNPAGVVFDADTLDERDMLEVARRVGLSETAFVSRSSVAGFKLDFFTPNRRIAHCGHATIAAFARLAELGRVQDGETSKETVDGTRRILIREGAAYMEQLAPAYRDPQDWSGAGVGADDVLASLGLNTDELDPRTPPVRVDTGNGFLLVAVRTGTVLAAIRPALERVAAVSDRLDLIGYYVFTTDAKATDMDATARMFAPRYAIDEESATGMAAGPLACLLHDRFGLRRSRFTIEQGVYMTPASPSRLDVALSLSHGRIDGLMVGGYGTRLREMTIDL